MIEKDQELRADYSDLVDRLMQGVQTVTRSPGASDGPLPLDPDSPAGRAYAQLPDVLAAFHPADLPRATALVCALEGHPRQHAEMLGVFGTAAGSRAETAFVACRAYALAARIHHALGEVDQARALAAALVGVARTDAWRRFGERLVREFVGVRRAVDAPQECLLLAALSPETRAAVAEALVLRHYPAGDYVCVEGNPAEELFLLRSGRVAVLHRFSQTGSAQGERFLRFRHAGESIGEMGVLSPQRLRTASCRAVAATQAWVLSFDDLATLMARFDDLREAVEARYHVRRLESWLAAHPLFAPVDLAQRAEIASHATPRRRFSAGEVLATAGAVVTHVTVLLDGEVTAETPGVGTALLSTEQAPTPIFGVGALLLDARHDATVRGHVSGWMAELPIDATRNTMSAMPGFESVLAAYLLP